MPPSRKNMRNNRKGNRKNRKCWTRKNRKQVGGSAMLQSLAQGRQFSELHSKQHGGAMLTGAPLSEISGSMLPQDLRSFARVGGLDDSIAAAATQRDPDQMPVQHGGRRRKNKKNSRKPSRKPSRKNKKNSRKVSRKNKKNSRKNRKNSRTPSRKNRKNQRGGAVGAPFNQPTMLLSASDAAKAGTADFSNPLLKH